MDKWDAATNRIKQALLAEEPEAVLAASFQLLAEFGRTLEQQSADLDRIATALEAEPVEIRRVGNSEPAVVHDL